MISLYHNVQSQVPIVIDIVSSVPAIELFGAPKPHSSYTLRGFLRISLTKPLKIKQIVVKFKGFSQNDRYSFSSSGRAASGRAVDDAYLVVERSEKVIESSPRTLPPGTTEIPFDISFSADIPPSCTLSRGSIRYVLSGRVVPDSIKYFWSSQGIRKSMPIVVRRSMLTTPEHISYLPTVRYRGRRAGRIEYEFEVPKIICLEQGKLKFSGRVSSLYDAARVKNILVRMDQTEIYRAISKDPRRRSFGRLPSNPIIDVTKPVELECSFDSDMTWEEPLTFELPLNNPQMFSDFDTPIIDVTHKLRVRISFADPIAEKDMWLSFPVIISTLPGPDFHSHFSPDSDIQQPQTQSQTQSQTQPQTQPQSDLNRWLNPPADAELPSYESIAEEQRIPQSPLAVVPRPSSVFIAVPPPSFPPPNRRYSSMPAAAPSTRRQDHRLSARISRSFLSNSGMTFAAGMERQDMPVFVVPF